MKNKRNWGSASTEKERVQQLGLELRPIVVKSPSECEARSWYSREAGEAQLRLLKVFLHSIDATHPSRCSELTPAAPADNTT